MEQQEEITLIKLAKRGDDEAFTMLFQSHYLFIYKYLLKLSFRRDIAEDLVQETMLKAYLHLKNFNGKAKFSTWLISIATRLFIDLQRKEKRRKLFKGEVQKDELRKLKWEVSLSREEWSLYLELFAQLEPEIRTPILLKHYYDYSYDEIAKMLDIKEGTVKSRIHYGLKKIRKEWTE